MPCEILIAAVGKSGVTKKGYPWIIKDIPCAWGTKERPPNWIVLRLNDASKAQVEHFLDSWYKYFAYEILAENEQGYRVKVTVDPTLISASGANRQIRSEMKDHIIREWDASVVSYDDNQAIVDIPKPVDLLALKADIYDIFSERIDTRFHYFSEADVDLALAQAGYIEMTKQQAFNRIKSKLDE